jgi:hypothetical protein
VAVEKVAFLEKLPKFGDGKCPGDPRIHNREVRPCTVLDAETPEKEEIPPSPQPAFCFSGVKNGKYYTPRSD